MLTVCAMYCTGLTAWRLRGITQKINKVMAGKPSSVVFLKNSDGSSDGITSALASSDLCVNSGECSVDDCFWSNEISQGISVAPKQKVYLNPFITFPGACCSIPFKFASNNLELDGGSENFYALVETDLLPLVNSQEQPHAIESFGTLLAWKVDTRLSFILQTNARHFSQMVLALFLQNNYLVNSGLPVSRVQTVDIEGTPQNFDEIVLHSRNKIAENPSSAEWEKHIESIKNLSVLANKASEYEIKKNLTEGKTGIVQPDLISSKNIEESLLNVVASPDTPKKKMLVLEKTGEKIHGLKVELQRQELLKSPINPTVALPGSDKPITPESPKFPTASPAKSPSPSVKSRVSVETESQKFPTGSPVKKPVFASNDKPSIVKMEPKNTKAEPNVAELDKKLPPKENVPNVNLTTKSFIDTEKQQPHPVTSPSKPQPLNLQPKQPEPQTKPSQTSKQPETQPKPSASPKLRKQQLIAAKPPNILVYSDSQTTRDNVIKTLGAILQKNTYTVYPLSTQQACSRIWLDNTTLLVVCGSINGSEVGSIFLEFFFKGGKVLCLCSDLLGSVLPTYHTAEVREHELVQFSYGKWKNIKMMHHIFCYQPSPVRKHFSQESDEPPKERPSSAENPSVELRDQNGIAHNIKVQTLGTEDTWKTPSLLLLCTGNSGKMIFSQIHLEVDPSMYESDDQKYAILMKNEGLRHEIFSDVLSSHLGLSTSGAKSADEAVEFTKGYFLGRHELKFKVLDDLKSVMETANTLKLDGLTVKFCGKNDTPPIADEHCLPVMIHACPDDFSTLDYFDSLKTNHIGRLLIYSKVLVGSSVLINKTKYSHGFAVIARKLKTATGRSGNQWLSPSGCLMFSLQLHIPLNSPLGQRIPLIQHLVATAVVLAFKKPFGYEDALDLNVKWPNDIYANSSVKIGGLIVNSVIQGTEAICNVGLGVNLSNSIPTTCINDLIADYNKKNAKNLPLLTYEKALTLVFNEIEALFERVQSGDLEYLYDMYYKCWLHSGTSVTVLSKSLQERPARILGIDDFGFLKILLDDDRIESVHPDGNSFDMLRGLIIPN